MALIKPPAPPEGFDYVVRNQNFTLVPKSELTEDICPATGRTWAEEARLYNIKNAPDGKKIAEPGDEFYQTAESMKNRGKELNGIGSSGLGFFNKLASSGESNGPSLEDTLNKIKSGAANADISSALGSIGDVAGSLSSNLSEGLASAQAAITEKIAAAQAQLPKLMAIAQANMDLTSKIAASQGRAPTEDELKQASGALTIFQDGPALLKAQAEGIGKELASVGEAFGAAIPKGIKDAGGAISAGIGKITDAAKSAGAAISSALGSVPVPTIPGPNGTTLPNPEFESFAAANPETAASFQNVLGKVTSLAGDLTSKFGAIETKQASAVAGGLADLKAFAFASQLAQPATGAIGAAKNLSVNPTSFDPTMIKKAISGASKIPPGPSSPIPPKDPQESVKPVGPPKDPPPTAEPKTAVFKKDPAEKISQSFYDAYYNYYKAWKDALDDANKDLGAVANKWFGAAIPGGYTSLRDRARQIEKDKPDSSLRTDEEKQVVKEHNEFRALFIEKSVPYLQADFFRVRHNEVSTAHNTIRQAFLDNATYGSLPKSVEDVSIKDEGPKDWKFKIPTPAYQSYADYQSGKPYSPPGVTNT